MKLLFGALVLVLSGCVSIPDQQVVAREYVPVGSKAFEYSDKNILVTYKAVSFGVRNGYELDNSIPIEFKNKTKNPIKIIWSESAFINPGGTSEKIINSGVRLMDRNGSVPDSMIIPEGRLFDIIVPANSIYWSGSSWDRHPLCGVLVPQPGRYLENDAECVGKEFGLFLTYEMNGKKKTFTMKYKFANRDEKFVPYQAKK